MRSWTSDNILWVFGPLLQTIQLIDHPNEIQRFAKVILRRGERPNSAWTIRKGPPSSLSLSSDSNCSPWHSNPWTQLSYWDSLAMFHEIPNIKDKITSNVPHHIPVFSYDFAIFLCRCSARISHTWWLHPDKFIWSAGIEFTGLNPPAISSHTVMIIPEKNFQLQWPSKISHGKTH